MLFHAKSRPRIAPGDTWNRAKVDHEPVVDPVAEPAPTQTEPASPGDVPVIEPVTVDPPAVAEPEEPDPGNDCSIPQETMPMTEGLKPDESATR